MNRLPGWLPAIAWMGLIFLASADPESGPRGSRLLAPLILWLAPDISPAALDATVLAARKVVHFVIFGILALLFLLPLLRGGADKGLRPFATALLLTFLYAVSDEIHQKYVPTREGSLRDVAIDTLGAAVALAGFRRIGRWRRR